MSTLLRFSGLAKSFGSRILFTDISGEVNSGQIIGLVGDNGCGKSTLLRMLSGLEESDAGHLDSSSPHFVTSYVPQELTSEDQAVREYVASGRELLWAWIKRLEDMEAEMSRCEPGDLEQLLRDYGELTSSFDASGGYNLASDAEKALQDVGLSEDFWDSSLCSLSGGQKTRACLARAVLNKPDLLLLDEPTNYLDFVGMSWLEEWLKKSGRTVLLVSHDRYFLDRVASHIWDLDFGRLQCYNGNYSAYREQREQNLLEQREEYARQKKEEKRLRELAERQMQWSHAAHKDAGQGDYLRGRAKKMAKRAKAVVSRLEQQMEGGAAKPEEKAGVYIHFDTPDGLGNLLVGASNLEFSYGSAPILLGVDFTIRGGERLAVIGENGAGKTTLLRLLLGELEKTAGNLKRSSWATVGYFSQERADLSLDRTALEELLTVEGLDRARAWHILGRLGFRGNEALKRLRICSLGERAKVSLAKLLVKQYHLLVLDEPTNHLDIRSREIIEEALQDYAGAIVLVCHDRYFMDAVVNQVYHLQSGKLTRYLGNYSYYESKTTTEPGQEERDEKLLVLRARQAYLATKLADLEPHSEEYKALEQSYDKVVLCLKKTNDHLVN